MNSYKKWINTKALTVQPSGFEPNIDNQYPFDFQQSIVERACRQGRFCIWADCGLGKAIMLLLWADQVCRHTQGNVLILAPLAVSLQIQREGEKFGVLVNVAINQSEVVDGINVTNYEKLAKFEPESFSGVVLDESSILKAHTGKNRTAIIHAFSETPYKLACSATPSPNDLMELGNHAEFMGVMSREEMLAMFFTHDGGSTSKWRLKKHAQEKFWDWVCEWAVMIRKPSDLGFDDSRFVLPKMNLNDLQITTEISSKDGQLFFTTANTLTEQRQVAKASMEERCFAAADIVNNSDERWLIWCNLNDESKMLAQFINDAVEVKGSDNDAHKESSMIAFQNGEIKALVSKPSICGFGMNFQSCHNVVFVGLSHSYEQFYQAVRRCYRFGQENEVNVYIVYHELEGAVIANVKRKEETASEMADQMVSRMKNKSLKLMGKTVRNVTGYAPTKKIKIARWLAESALEDFEEIAA